jgi:hypothetical protein
MIELREEIKIGQEEIIEEVKKEREGHVSGCPLNQAGVNNLVDNRLKVLADDGLGEIIDNKINDSLKEKGLFLYKGFKGLLRDFILIASAITAFIAVSKLFN